MGYDRGDSFLFDFEPNGNSFGSKSNEKLSVQTHPIQFDRKLNSSFIIGRSILRTEERFLARVPSNTPMSDSAQIEKTCVHNTLIVYIIHYTIGVLCTQYTYCVHNTLIVYIIHYIIGVLCTQ